MAGVVVVGAQWGDEGKGKIVDWLSSRADVVVRFQGGHNAGHTLVIDGKVFKLALLPSGLVRGGKLSVIGNGVVVDPWHMLTEIDGIRQQGVEVTPETLALADNASLILPWHKDIDAAREGALGSAQIGTTKRGIGPAYEDRVGRRAIRVADLADPAALDMKIERLLAHHRPLRLGLDLPEPDGEALKAELLAIAPQVLAYAQPVWKILDEQVRAGKRILFEGAQGVMLDNDGTGEKRALLVSDAQLVEGDSGQREAVFDVRLSRPSETDITVEYTTVSGSAQSGEDFAPTTGTITFLAGQTIAAVHVPVYGDTALEASEQFSLVLSPPQGADFAAGEAGVEATATILDDDASDTQPVISIADIAIHEGNSTYGPNIEFVVTLSAPSTETVQVAYTTVDGSAQAGNDYIGASGTLSFAPGQTSAVVALTSYGYSVVEPDETFTLQLSSPQNAVLAGGVDTLSATGTIIDNDDTAPVDGLPILSVADIQVQEASGGSTAIFTLNLSSPSAIEVSGDFSVAAGTATAGDDFTPVAGTFSFAPGETSVTVEVAIAEDLIQEPTETIVLRLENLENGQFSNFADQLLAIGEILDQEVAGLSLDVGIDANQSEGTTFSRLISFSDGEDSNGDGWTYEVDWGDGSAVETGATTDPSFSISRELPDGDADQTVTVTVFDGAESVSDSFQLSTNNVAPTIGLSGAATVDEGSEYTLTLGDIVDPGDDSVTEYVINWGDGSSDTIAAVDLPASGEVSHTYSNGPAAPTIRMDLVDEDGTHENAGSLSLTVNNVAPTIAISGADSVDEGSPYSLTLGDIVDPGDDDHSITVDWGDGSAVETIAVGTDSVDHVFADGASTPTISVTVTDSDGASTTATQAVTVNNVAPTLNLSGATSIVAGQLYSLTLSDVVDPGDDTVSSYIIDWGDGNSDTIAAADLPASGEVTHTFETAGEVSIRIDLVDEDGTTPTSVVAPRLSTADLRGKALVVHAGGDTYSDTPPLGGGGARIACGVVER